MRLMDWLFGLHWLEVRTLAARDVSIVNREPCGAWRQQVGEDSTSSLLEMALSHLLVFNMEVKD